MFKKAVELSLNAVIIAAIALIVLVVLVLIFTNQGGKFNRGLLDCESRGGNPDDCTRTSADCVDEGGIPNGDCIFFDKQTGEKKPHGKDSWKCCVKG